MTINFSGSAFFNPAAQVLTNLARLSARPNFELIFSNAQATALERFNKEIETFQDSEFGQGKTALLKIKAARLKRALEEAQGLETVATTNRLTVKDVLDQLSDLRSLADSSTVTEFDAKRTEILDNIDKLRTTTSSRFAAPDGLRDTKADATADLEGIVHNNFATAGDIQAAQDTIDSLTTTLTGKLAILEINQDIATNMVASLGRTFSEVDLKIEDIEIAERKRQIDKIKDLQDELARIFTAFSLAFEGSQFLSDFVARGAVLERRPDPGSVLNLFA